MLFEWDEIKETENRKKHGVSFEMAKRAFLDPFRIIVENLDHGFGEKRWFCLGDVEEGILTV